jgi:hypothetical protein
MSTIVALIGPIEWWWNTPEDPGRFNSQQAQDFRAYRTGVKKYLGSHGFLCYAPWDAFFGDWDPRAQAHNDFIIGICDVVCNLRPVGIPGSGTDDELELAADLGKPVVDAPPGSNLIEIAARIGAQSIRISLGR